MEKRHTQTQSQLNLNYFISLFLLLSLLALVTSCGKEKVDKSLATISFNCSIQNIDQSRKEIDVNRCSIKPESEKYRGAWVNNDLFKNTLRRFFETSQPFKISYNTSCSRSSNQDTNQVLNLTISRSNRALTTLPPLPALNRISPNRDICSNNPHPRGAPWSFSVEKMAEEFKYSSLKPNAHIVMSGNFKIDDNEENFDFNLSLQEK